MQPLVVIGGGGVVPFDLVYLHTEWTIVTVLKRCRERKLSDRLSALLPCSGGYFFHPKWTQ